MAHAVMSAITVAASVARPGAKVTARSTMFAKRCETRKLAAQAATRSVQARAITEVTADAADANSASTSSRSPDGEFSYKVGDRVSGKVFTATPRAPGWTSALRLPRSAPPPRLPSRTSAT